MSRPSPARWQWPLDRTRYDQTPHFRDAEWAALTAWVERHGLGGGWPHAQATALRRLLQPLDDVLTLATVGTVVRRTTTRVLLRALYTQQAPYWAWTEPQWLAVFTTPATTPYQRASRVDAHPYLVLFSYLVADFTTFSAIKRFNRYRVAMRVFGAARVDHAVAQVHTELLRWGTAQDGPRKLRSVVATLLLQARSPDLAAVTAAALERTAADGGCQPILVNRVSRALVGLGILTHTLRGATTARLHPGAPDTLADVPPVWVRWVQRWYDTSPLPLTTRYRRYYTLLKTGRWLGATHPEAVAPEHWTRALTAEYVGVVARMRVGEWAHAPSTYRYVQRLGHPLSARAKASQLGALRTFFQDCQTWEWLPRRFDPQRALATPRAITALIGPSPRLIADDVWAKLVWAGLNLTASDLPVHHYVGAPWYPVELVRALAMLWFFAGLRSDELVRLRLGCVRWQAAADAPTGAAGASAPASICWLDVPVNKTGTAFTKAIDRVVGEAVEAWEHGRRVQPALVDPKTGEVVDYLFVYRGLRVSRTYLNRSLIPLLCRKAGVPLRDARGRITSHRARSTIASQLANGKEPMSLFELQDWLGHRQVASTLSYVKPTPTRLAKAYTDAAYFQRNLRAIEVLIDQEAVRSGAAADGEPWKFYDLGHGYCTYDFFDQCPHRMACAKCSFYRPKGSTQAQLLEGKANLQRMLQAIPLTDTERTAVEEGIVALEQLSTQLADVPTPAGPTPRQLATWQRTSIALGSAARSAERRGEGGVGGAGEGVGA